MNKTTLIVGIMVVIIIVLLITNYVKLNQINAQQSPLESFDKSPIEKPIADQALTNQAPPILREKQKDDIFVLYYTEWCGASQQFKPIWERFLKETKTGIKTATIECDQKEGICRKAGIRAYPTVILHKVDGTNVEFLEQRTVQNLENFVNQNRSQ